MELLLRAGYAGRDEKRGFAETASNKFDSLKFFLRVAWEAKALDHKKYAALSAPLGEVGRMLGGWLKTLHK